MAILGFRRARRRPQYAQKVYSVAARAHRLVAKAWPRSRGGAKTTRAQLQRDDMANRQGWVRVLKDVETRAMREGIAEFSKAHTGLQGSQIMRHRDAEDQRLAGRLWAIRVEGFGTFWPEAAAQDVSDAFDWMEPLHGSLLVRTDKTWLPTVPCKAGSVLTLMFDPHVPQCCEPARFAKPREAVESSP